MTHAYDLVIRGGTLIDGSGRPGYVGDIAIRGKTIAAIGEVNGRGAEEIDAHGKIVTPGFVDVHTHYDGQATWEHTMAPSSGHGVSTVVTGNCGVGFAPCRQQDRETLVAVLEGVEDIPEAVMAEGLPWNWETFPEYLEALEQRHFDVDIATQLPHSPLRVYVMGQRGIDREPSTDDDRNRMRSLTTEAIRAGAFGVTTSRSHMHRRVSGDLSPSVEADEQELYALAQGLKEAGRGVFQLIPDIPAVDPVEEFDVIERVARMCGRPLSFTLTQSHDRPAAYRGVLARLDAANAAGLEINAQIAPRPIGMLFGLDLSFHPFKLKPSFRALEALPLEEKVRAMRDPALREKLLAEEQDDPNPVLVRTCRLNGLYALGDPPNYFPATQDSFEAIAARTHRSLEEVAYDALLQNDGHAILYRPSTNFENGAQTANREQLAHPRTVVGLGDGGAHYGLICDASFPTFVLTHWVRDSADGFALPWAVKALSHDTARVIGFKDRGLLAPGYKADINVIDFEKLRLGMPRVVRNLPAGGRRLTQSAEGYDVSIVSGKITYRHGKPTGELPGRLVRSTAS
ncbi:MAG: N-acyl-D-amino-acid deacylase family protein [Janthinobacterium lividum]